MNNGLLGLMACMMLSSSVVKAEESDTDVSLDFNYNGITYTIVNETEHTCRTKSGSFSLNSESSSPMYKVTYGNVVTGEVNIPEIAINGEIQYTVIGIGELGFTGMTSVTLPSTLTEIGSYAFLNDDKLTSISIPESVTSFGKYVFSYCTSLTHVDLPSSMTIIPDCTFQHCTSLTDIDIPSSLESIGERAFAGSGLQSITFPSSCVTLGPSAFSGCRSLTTVTLSDSIVAIPAYAFENCNSIIDIILPESVAQLGYYAFWGCKNLTNVTCNNHTPPAISPNTFGGLDLKSINLWVPKTSLLSYTGNTVWGGFNISAIPCNAEGVSLDKSSLILDEGLSSKLTAIVSPADATDAITWSATSTPSGAVSVDATGKVSTYMTGQGVVTVTCGNYSAQCEVTVVTNTTAAVKIDALSEVLYPGSEVMMKATPRPSTLTSPIIWSSSNTDVATINENTGVLTAVMPGSAVISATCGDITGKYVITVLPVEATDITLNQSSLTMNPGDSETLTATVIPDNTTYSVVTWTSNDDNVVTVTDGIVTAVAPGRATVTAICGTVTAICTVLVNEIPVESIDVTPVEATLNVTQSVQLSALLTPANTTSRNIVWATENEGVATVSIDGMVTATGLGQTSISATCGDFSSTCAITVEPTLANEVTISMTSLILRASQNQQLTASVPENTTNKTITWQSDNTAVASVSSDGLVTAHTVGQANITASCDAVSATCSVVVEATPAEGVQLSESILTIDTGKSVTLQATVLPETATDKTVEWSVDAVSIVDVDNGRITALEPGQAIVTARCGDAVATCYVTVVKKARSVTLNYPELKIEAGDVEDLIAMVDPADTTDDEVWESSDTDVAVVGTHGIVEALKPGQTTVKVTYGDVSASCVVTVTANTQSLVNVKVDIDGRYRVYTLGGIEVLNTKNHDEVMNLEPGIYIVNGQKVMIH